VSLDWRYGTTEPFSPLASIEMTWPRYSSDKLMFAPSCAREMNDRRLGRRRPSRADQLCGASGKTDRACAVIGSAQRSAFMNIANERTGKRVR
jgi:hypothetical protein